MQAARDEATIYRGSCTDSWPNSSTIRLQRSPFIQNFNLYVIETKKIYFFFVDSTSCFSAKHFWRLPGLRQLSMQLRLTGMRTGME
ncbi:hypothetical protein BB8028_0002g05770 [Beauveria bassiana]|uniref:Uncharacterized protein n=1 Tax=Beauveria bassiana TaxID=176275 RepID=A0A2S7Y2V3_BEABA|nr:hypothetical protein BB8028_0002g05770 [Beauveria bassiana]